ncbi:hypothetical protein GOBAR_DD06955 [Gossypium barbadense]|nr:hypothetical protein GOBAR_DD06955 [Gossypium barbadense]
MAKEKGVVIANGWKPNLNILKPSKKVEASSLSPKNNPFYDRLRMDPIELDRDLEPIHFQAISPMLKGKKILAIRFMAKEGVEVVKAHPQFIHMRVQKLRSHTLFLCSVVYSVDKVEDPWLVVGDFNTILRSDEWKGGFEYHKVGCNRSSLFVF